MLADDGTPIQAFQNRSGDSGFDTDCHGNTFADGDYWISNDQVDKVLTGDSYQQVDSPNTGDVAVYKDANGQVLHSTTVVGTKNDGTLMVEGLGGLETETSVTTAADAWSDDATIEYYTKPNPDPVIGEETK